MAMGWGLGEVCLQDGTMDARRAHKGSAGIKRNAHVLHTLWKTGADGVILAMRWDKRNFHGWMDEKHPFNVQVAKLSHTMYPHLSASPGFLAVRERYLATPHLHRACIPSPSPHPHK